MLWAGYADRAEAGAALAEQVADLLAGRQVAAATGQHVAADLLIGQAAPADGPVVLALPRGGVPVAAPVADRLGAELDVVLVRKLGLPWQPELAMGAVARVAGAEHVVRNEKVLAGAQVSDAVFARVLAAERAVLAARARDYRGGLPDPDLAGRAAVLVDDGMATGATMRAAVIAVRAVGAAWVLVAVPVGSVEAVSTLAAIADQVLCPRTPRPFRSVGAAYQDFAQTTDDEVRRLLATS
jgi:predicted phosphoribosyltransferase